MQFISRINKEKKAKRITTIEKISACILQGLISCSGLKSSMSSELDEFSEIKSESEAKNLADKIIKKLETPQSE